MKKKFITLQGLKEVLSDGELKNVLGGSGGGNYCGGTSVCSGGCFVTGLYCRYLGKSGGLAVCQCQQ